MPMNGIQVTGIVLIAVGSLFALGSASMTTMTFGGDTGYGGPSGSFSIGSGNLPWISLGIAALGVVLVVVGRDQQAK